MVLCGGRKEVGRLNTYAQQLKMFNVQVSRTRTEIIFLSCFIGSIKDIVLLFRN